MEARDPANPLLQLRFEVLFDQLRPEHIEPAIAELLAQDEAELDAIEAQAAPPTYENTVLAIAEHGWRIESAMGVISLLASVTDDPAMLACSESVFARVTESRASLWWRRPSLTRRLQTYLASAAQEQLGSVQARLVRALERHLTNCGVGLPRGIRQRIVQLDQQLVASTQRYSRNLANAERAFAVCVDDVARLAGLPDWAIDAAKKRALELGKAGYVLIYASFEAQWARSLMHDQALRKELWLANRSLATVGEGDNLQAIQSILELRAEKAALLGFQSFADLVLGTSMRMAGSVAEIEQFVQRLAARARLEFAREHRELLEYRRHLEGPNAPELEPWDIDYYAERLRTELYGDCDQRIRDYLTLADVLDGLFETAQRLFGVSIRPNLSLSKWHSDVRAYDMRDEDGSLLAHFYLDLHQRQGKPRSGGWYARLSNKRSADQVPVGVLVQNMTGPGERSRLAMGETVTLFEMFGHLLHHCLDRTTTASLNSEGVALELTHMVGCILGHWITEYEAIGSWARHWHTREPMPEMLFVQAQRSRRFRSATRTMRQLGYALTDLRLHSDPVPETPEAIAARARDVFRPFLPTGQFEVSCEVATLRHVFAHPIGYGAGYYVFRWGQALAADAFTRFQQQGVFSPSVGAAFRRCILERGDTEDATVLYESFMGRSLRLDAFADREGLSEGRPPNVFISYSHDSLEHKRWVEQLAESLVALKVDVTLDKWHLRPGDDTVRFMQDGVAGADRVLVICTPEYVRRAETGKGGVGFEANFIYGELIRNLGTAKFIPVVRVGGSTSVPTALLTRRAVDLTHRPGPDYERELEELVHTLRGLPTHGDGVRRERGILPGGR